jgi:hypothetical protein
MGAQQTKPTIVEVSDSSTPYIIEDPYVFKKDFDIFKKESNNNANSLKLAYETGLVETNAKFNNYYTKDELKDIFALQSQLTNYQPKGNYALKNDLNKYQLVGDYATQRQLLDYQPAGDYVIRIDLEDYQPKGNYQPAGNYALRNDLLSYQPKGNYILQDQLNMYQPKGDYVVRDQLNNYLLTSRYNSEVFPIQDFVNKLRNNTSFTRLYRV